MFCIILHARIGIEGATKIKQPNGSIDWDFISKKSESDQQDGRFLD